MKIFLSAGHGGGPRSNRGSLIGNEGDNNFHYSLVLKEELEKYEGVTVGLAKTDVNQNPTLEARGKAAKGYDLLLSLHSNAFSNNTANGFVLFDSVEKPNRVLATNLQNNLSKLFRYNRGVQYKEHPTQKGRSYYGILRYSLAKSSMMLEHGFHTNMEDAKVYVNNRKGLAEVTASTIAKHYNLKLKDGKKPTPTPTPTPTPKRPVLKYGNIGTAVKEMQTLLIKHGFTMGKYGADSSFGTATLAAVKKFQKAKGLVVDGSVGPATWAELDKSVAPEKREHTVKRDQTMSSIAKAYGLTLKELIDANPQIKDPNLIYVGQVINIPAKGDVDIQVGDIVHFLGGAHYSSSNASRAAHTKLASGPAKVTQIHDGKYPYHLIHTNRESRVYGWVSASQVSKR